MTEPEPPKLPEVRQCQSPDDPEYGSVWIESLLPQFAGGVWRPGGLGAGGHWESTDETVKDWKVVK